MYDKSRLEGRYGYAYRQEQQKERRFAFGQKHFSMPRSGCLKSI